MTIHELQNEIIRLKKEKNVSILAHAERGTDQEYIIGTESSIVKHLQYRGVEKLFYPLSKDRV